ncbi:MAG: hypothetical protein ACR2PL_26460 [Dehalococcoidia bacterium]
MATNWRFWNGDTSSALWDGVVWLLPAIAAAFLSLAMHRNEHHRMRSPERVNNTEEGMWKTEHTLAYVMTAAAIVFGLLGMLVGFHILGRGNHQWDSMPWHLASIGVAVLANTFHTVGHHQLADDDFIVERPAPTTEQARTSTNRR